MSARGTSAPSVQKLRAAVVLALPLGGLACGRETPPATARTPPPAPAPSYVLHEWGFVGTSMENASMVVGARVADGTRGFGTGGIGLYGTGTGKPVVYVHLDPGLDELRFGLHVGPPEGGAVLEAWPGARIDHGVDFDVVARRGPCASPTPAPEPGSPFCTNVADAYCEASEVARYGAERDTCLHVGDATSELLLYRTGAPTSPPLPWRLEYGADGITLVRGDAPDPGGPLLYVDRTHTGAPIILDLRADGAGPVHALSGRSRTPDEARARLEGEAVARGLLPSEAEALVDAWASAFHAQPRRQGPGAGSPPEALGAYRRALLYFADASFVAAIAPLRAEPSPREVRRVFLVRVADETTRERSMLGMGTYGMGLTRRAVDPSAARLDPSRVQFESSTRSTLDVPREVVLSSLESARGSLMRCYAQFVAGRLGDTDGLFRVELTVGPDGATSDPRAFGYVMRDELTVGCVVSALGRVRLPPSPGGGNLTVVVRFDWDGPQALDTGDAARR